MSLFHGVSEILGKYRDLEIPVKVIESGIIR